jgi:hypothetical protein
MTRPWHSYLIVMAIGTATVGSAPLGAAEKEKIEPLAIAMSHYIATAESDVVVRMRVAPDIRSRELIVEWVADDLSGGSHTITLEGDRAAVSHRYALKRMAPGSYVVTAILRRDDGTEVKRAATVSVYGIGGTDAVAGGAGQQSTRGGLRPAGRR